MKRFFRLFTRSSRPRDRAWTLDHDGGVVVSIASLQKSGALASQLRGLDDLEALISEERKRVRTPQTAH